MMRVVPRVPPHDRLATYEDLRQIPDTMVAEIVDGELHVSARPAPRHAVAGAGVGAGWRRSRMPRIPDTAYFTLAPDWGGEILSPSTASFDRGHKLAAFAREGVGHAWLIDLLARTLEVLGLQAGKWVVLRGHTEAEVVRAAPFGAVLLELRAFWVD